MVIPAFDWTSLPADSVIVDVGGGVGTSSLVLAQNLPNVKIIVQDLPPVVKDGQAVRFYSDHKAERLFCILSIRFGRRNYLKR